jgi:hypothetical protein
MRHTLKAVMLNDRDFVDAMLLYLKTHYFVYKANVNSRLYETQTYMEELSLAPFPLYLLIKEVTVQLHATAALSLSKLFPVLTENGAGGGAECLEILEPQPPGTPRACPGL